MDHQLSLSVCWCQCALEIRHSYLLWEDAFLQGSHSQIPPHLEYSVKSGYSRETQGGHSASVLEGGQCATGVEEGAFEAD
ncbi:hypothetical protein FKM82_027580 [Ascaphus truei]